MTAAAKYILIRSGQSENNYGKFTLEILQAEGLIGFEIWDIDEQGLPPLEPDDLAVLTRCFLHKAEIEKLLLAVGQGTNLICLQPQTMLSEQLGWKTKCSVAYPGYIKPSENFPGAGLKLQSHVPVCKYTPCTEAAWQQIAQIACEDSSEPYPAIVSGQIDKGNIAIFFYDLPMAVARIRFGNPDLASYITTDCTWPWPHAADMFTDHVDDDLLDIPQADIHCQLLAKVISDLSSYIMPRLWYYPRSEHRSAFIFQSDGDCSTVEQFDELSDCLVKHGGSASFYLMEQTNLSVDDVNRLRKKGHTFAPHVFGVDGQDELYFRMPQMLREHTKAFEQKFGKSGRTLQGHFAPWMGYMSWLPTHIEMDYHLLFAFISIPLQRFGNYMCGSGRPMRFYDQQGNLHDCWQQPVTILDDTTLKDYLTNNVEQAFAEFQGRLDNALTQTHTAFGILSHPLSFVTYSRPFMEKCLDLAVKKSVPIFNGDQWLEFLERRSAVQIEPKQQNNTDAGNIAFSVANVIGRITIMVPVKANLENTKDIEVQVDGEALRKVKFDDRLNQQFIMLDFAGGPNGSTFDVQITWHKES